MDYKKHYTEEELHALVSWFDKHMNELPQSLQVDAGTYLPHLKHTVQLYYDIIDEHKNNPTYAAQIFLLYKIQEALQKQWGKEERQQAAPNNV